MATTITNDGEVIAGTGHYSHPVPATLGCVVLMRDGNHQGTEVYRVEGGWRFVSLDRHCVDTAARCVLVRLSGVSVEDIGEPNACDLDSGDGMALIGCDPGDEVPGEVIWDSAR